MQEGDLQSLVSPDRLEGVAEALRDILWDSFVRDGAKKTEAEIKRRFTLCYSIFRTLRCDFQWSLPRILDTLPGYLRCELEGMSWQPSERAIWLPNEIP